MFKIKNKELKNEIKLAKKVAKNKAKEVLVEAKRVAKETTDKKLAKQIIKSAKKSNREMVKEVVSEAKHCVEVEEVKAVLEENTAINVEKRVEQIKEAAAVIINEKRAAKSNTLFGKIKRISKIKQIIGELFINGEVSEVAQNFIEKVSFEKFCQLITNTLISADEISLESVIEAMKNVIYGENGEIIVEGCVQ